MYARTILLLGFLFITAFTILGWLAITTQAESSRCARLAEDRRQSFVHTNEGYTRMLLETAIPAYEQSGCR